MIAGQESHDVADPQRRNSHGVAIAVARHPMVRAAVRAAPLLITPRMRTIAADATLDAAFRAGTLGPKDCAAGLMLDLKSLIRTIPDYPKPGILFRDITTLIEDPAGFKESVARLARAHEGLGITHVAGIEARGFIFGAGVAIEMGVGFVPIRKRGKLPGATIGQNYTLEYGVDTIEIHADVLTGMHKVLLVDDLIATGGTALAAVGLLRRTGAVVENAAFVIDLVDLGGADRLRGLGVRLESLVSFEGH